MKLFFYKEYNLFGNNFLIYLFMNSDIAAHLQFVISSR